MYNHTIAFDPTLSSDGEQVVKLVERDIQYHPADTRVEIVIVNPEVPNTDPTLTVFYEPIPVEGNDG